MDEKSAEAIIRSILEIEPDAPKGPSAAVLNRLTALGEEGDLNGFAELFVAYAKAKRTNARFVEEKIPAKIVETFLIRRAGSAPSAVVEWQRREPDWAARLKEAVWNPTLFEAQARMIARRAQGMMTDHEAPSASPRNQRNLA